MTVALDVPEGQVFITEAHDMGIISENPLSILCKRKRDAFRCVIGVDRAGHVSTVFKLQLQRALVVDKNVRSEIGIGIHDSILAAEDEDLRILIIG